ncbi:MAG: hypothetical protein J4432_04885 [DPANN group archaeon]|nr:hypothetical protein [DPANN group archaeon]
MTKKQQDEVLVWQDAEGKYKLGYSQYLDMQKLKWQKFIFAALIVLIVLLIVGGAVAWNLVQRIDALDPIGKLAALR